nr:PTS transporter subunit EIIC [Lachnospiraceae bacterium]
MKDKMFGVLQRVGRSFMLPIAILPVAGLLLGIGSSFTNEATLEMYGLTGILGEGTFLRALLLIMNAVGSVIFDNLPILFAVGVAIGMAKKEKEVAALSAVIAYFVMNIAINAMLKLNGEILDTGEIAGHVLEGTIASSCGILTLQMGVFGGVIVGLGVAALHNRFYKIQLPNALSFFGGTRFVPIISTIVYMFVGILMYFVWPQVQNGISALGGLVTGSGYVGTLIFGLIKRALIPFGLHHVFYMPFWHTAVGGTMEVAGQMVQGGQNIFFAQLADAANVAHFSSDATRFFSGEFIFMIFGLPGAALAMYHCAKPEKKKAAGGLLLSAALACMATGITEPIEFSFLFVAPILFVVQVILAGSAYMVAHMLDIAVGLTFSGGFIDLLLFGILQGNEKTSWMLIVPVGIIYFFLYYFIFRYLILKLDLKTPGREDEDVELKLYTKADVQARKDANGNEGRKKDVVSAAIVQGLGGKENISDVDCCATRLRCTVKDKSLVDDKVLRGTGASGVLHKGNGVQIIYGPNVTVIKSDLEEYMEQGESAPRSEEKNMATQGTVISSPITGIAQKLSGVPDEAFAEGMMGDGVFVLPQKETVYAPEDGMVEFVFDTKHAIGFVTDSGVSLLIHVGIDTVKLQGKGFEVFVKTGERVKKGTPLMRINLEYLEKHAPSVATPIVCTQLEEKQQVILRKEGLIEAGQPLFEIAEKERKI